MSLCVCYARNSENSYEPMQYFQVIYVRIVSIFSCSADVDMCFLVRKHLETIQAKVMWQVIHGKMICLPGFVVISVRIFVRK